MLKIEPTDRISTKEALKLIAPHVELEPKIQMMERAREALYVHKATEKINHNAPDEDIEIKGPFKSWSRLEKVIKEVMEVKRPRYFIWELQLAGEIDMVYCQGYYDGAGWAIECLSEEFSDSKHTADQKRKFMDLGWNPPSEESPNYQRDVASLDAKISIAHMIDAFEQGYKVKPSDITLALIKAVDLGQF
jgi:hypothetical protein